MKKSEVKELKVSWVPGFEGTHRRVQIRRGFFIGIHRTIKRVVLREA